MTTKQLKLKRKLSKIPRHIILIVMLLFMLYPVFMVVINSLKTEAELYSNPMGLPAVANCENYQQAVVDGNLGQAFLNSLLVTGVSVVDVYKRQIQDMLLPDVLLRVSDRKAEEDLQEDIRLDVRCDPCDQTGSDDGRDL